MRLVLPVLALVACNTAPTDYRDGRAPGAKAPYAGPTDTSCVARGETDTRIDGYYYCGQEEGAQLVPVDDPLFTPCRDVAAADTRVLSVFDGTRGRAYVVDELLGRELVNDMWGDDPLLIDF